MTTTTVYDAVDVTALPADTEVALGYLDGAFTTGHAQKVRARFPNARIITVTTTGESKAMLCDCENGDATPQIAAAGIRGGQFGAVYFNLATEPILDALLAGLSWHRYAADWTGTPHLVAGAVGTQYASPGHGSPGDYDVSLVTDAWLAALFPPAPVVYKGVALPVLAEGAVGSGVVMVQRAVNGIGYDPALTCDGYFGPLTAAGLRAFQILSGIPATGVVDAATWSRIAVRVR